jgi:transcriptional regulator with XRE-family HTH domain
MPTQLGALFKSVRTGQGRTLQSLAAAIGYANFNKGARRIERLEREGVESAEFVERLASALGIDREQVANLGERDNARRRAEFEEWVRMPQRHMELHRFLAGITLRAFLPEGLSEDEAIAHAKTVQKAEGLRMCLMLDRRRSLWFTSDGATYETEATPERPDFPFTTLG